MKYKQQGNITSDDNTYLKRLREKFHNRIQKLDENETPCDISNNEENNKRYWSVSITEKYCDKDLYPVQHNEKRMRTYQAVTSKF